MNRIGLFATTALWVVGCVGAANAKTGELTAYGDLGLSHFNYDFDNDFDVTTDVFQGSGAVVKGFTPTFFGQVDFAYLSQEIDSENSPLFATSATRIGVTGFWREQGQGLIGGEVAYNSLDMGKAAPGFRVGVRGELFFDGATTFGGALGYHTYDPDFQDSFDGWYGNLFAKHYVQPQLAFTLRGDYFTYDGEGGQGFSSDDFSQWDLTAEGEYLLTDCDMSIYGGVTYGQPDEDSSEDVDAWALNVGFRFYLNQDGSLVARQRTGALAPTTTGLRPFF